MDRLLNLAISYPDFKLNQIIDPEQFDLNNKQIVDKCNQIIASINTLTQENTGGTNVTITPLPEFPTATNVQTALQQIATFAKGNRTTINEILAKNTTQDNRLASLETRANTNDTKNTTQDNRLTSLETRATNVETKNTSQDSTLSTHETRLISLETNTYNKATIDSKFSDHNNVAHDDKYYRKSEVFTKEEVGTFLKGGDTSIIYEVYTIVTPNGGDGTFTYSDQQGNTYTGQLTETEGMVFELRKGFYNLGLNRIEVTINDTLTRSLASGGIKEIDETHFELTNNEQAGTELTIKYYQRIDLQGQYQVYVGSVQPPFTSATMWFKTLG